MPKSVTVVFNRSLLAIAIVSLSACSSTPEGGSDFGLSSVGNGIVRAGKATANVGRKTWNKTTYLLGFSDGPEQEGDNPADEQLLIANEDADQVLPIADLPAIERTDTDRPVLVQQATAASSAEPLKLGAANPVDTETTRAPDEDLIHEVAANETLWDIAKRTTGNANNWHELADLNSLEQNATVFPGQKLVIPAALVKPDYNAPSTAGDSTELAEASVETAAADTAQVAQASVEATTGDTLKVLDTAVETDDTAELADTAVESGESALATADATIDSVEAAVVAGAQNISEEPSQSELTVAADKVRLSIPTPDDADKQASDASSELASASEEAEGFEVQEGETLWDLAKRTTGDATNWQAIASHNKFTEKQASTVRPGQTIFVPSKLVSDYRKAASAAAVSVETTTPVQSVAATASSVEPTTTVAANTELDKKIALATEKALAAEKALAEERAKFTENALAEERALITESELAAATTDLTTQQEPATELNAQTLAGTSLADETQPIKIVEATYKSDDTLEPVQATSEPIQMAENGSIPAQIMVSGTYYPKAVYNNADFSSSLLMRVSPGTTLQVSRAMGTWFEVKTDKGVGYVHQRDIQ